MEVKDKGNLQWKWNMLGKAAHRKERHAFSINKIKRLEDIINDTIDKDSYRGSCVLGEKVSEQRNMN